MIKNKILFMLMPWLITTGRRINMVNIIFSFWFKIDPNNCKEIVRKPRRRWRLPVLSDNDQSMLLQISASDI